MFCRCFTASTINFIVCYCIIILYYIYYINAVATIGFEQPSYTFREGVDTSIEVCFKILSPESSQISEDVFATVFVDPRDASAIGIDFKFNIISFVYIATVTIYIYIVVMIAC